MTTGDEVNTMSEAPDGEWYGFVNRFNQPTIAERGRPLGVYQQGVDGEVCRCSFLEDMNRIIADHAKATASDEARAELAEAEQAFEKIAGKHGFPDHRFYLESLAIAHEMQERLATFRLKG